MGDEFIGCDATEDGGCFFRGRIDELEAEVRRLREELASTYEVRKATKADPDQRPTPERLQHYLAANPKIFDPWQRELLAEVRALREELAARPAQAPAWWSSSKLAENVWALAKEARAVADNIRDEFPYLAGNLDKLLKPFEGE